MEDRLAALLFWLVLLAPLAFLVRQWRRLRRGECSRGRAVAGFVGIALLPAASFAVAFMVVIGVESVLGVPLVGDAFARAFPLVAAIALVEVVVLTLLFAIAARFIRVRD